MPAMHGVGRQTNQSADEVHVTCPQDVNDVLSHQVSVLLTETLIQGRLIYTLVLYNTCMYNYVLLASFFLLISH